MAGPWEVRYKSKDDLPIPARPGTPTTDVGIPTSGPRPAAPPQPDFNIPPVPQPSPFVDTALPAKPLTDVDRSRTPMQMTPQELLHGKQTPDAIADMALWEKQAAADKIYTGTLMQGVGQGFDVLTSWMRNSPIGSAIGEYGESRVMDADRFAEMYEADPHDPRLAQQAMNNWLSLGATKLDPAEITDPITKERLDTSKKVLEELGIIPDYYVNEVTGRYEPTTEWQRLKMAEDMQPLAEALWGGMVYDPLIALDVGLTPTGILKAFKLGHKLYTTSRSLARATNNQIQFVGDMVTGKHIPLVFAADNTESSRELINTVTAKKMVDMNTPPVEGVADIPEGKPIQPVPMGTDDAKAALRKAEEEMIVANETGVGVDQAAQNVVDKTFDFIGPPPLNVVDSSTGLEPLVEVIKFSKSKTDESINTGKPGPIRAAAKMVQDEYRNIDKSIKIPTEIKFAMVAVDDALQAGGKSVDPYRKALEDLQKVIDEKNQATDDVKATLSNKAVRKIGEDVATDDTDMPLSEVIDDSGVYLSISQFHDEQRAKIFTLLDWLRGQKRRRVLSNQERGRLFEIGIDDTTNRQQAMQSLADAYSWNPMSRAHKWNNFRNHTPHYASEYGTGTDLRKANVIYDLKQQTDELDFINNLYEEAISTNDVESAASFLSRKNTLLGKIEEGINELNQGTIEEVKLLKNDLQREVVDEAAYLDESVSDLKGKWSDVVDEPKTRAKAVLALRRFIDEAPDRVDEDRLTEFEVDVSELDSYLDNLDDVKADRQVEDYAENLRESYGEIQDYIDGLSDDFLEDSMNIVDATVSIDNDVIPLIEEALFKILSSEAGVDYIPDINRVKAIVADKASDVWVAEMVNYSLKLTDAKKFDPAVFSLEAFYAAEPPPAWWHLLSKKDLIFHSKMERMMNSRPFEADASRHLKWNNYGDDGKYENIPSNQTKDIRRSMDQSKVPTKVVKSRAENYADHEEVIIINADYPLGLRVLMPYVSPESEKALRAVMPEGEIFSRSETVDSLLTSDARPLPEELNQWLDAVIADPNQVVLGGRTATPLDVIKASYNLLGEENTKTAFMQNPKAAYAAWKGIDNYREELEAQLQLMRDTLVKGEVNYEPVTGRVIGKRGFDKKALKQQHLVWEGNKAQVYKAVKLWLNVWDGLKFPNLRTQVYDLGEGVAKPNVPLPDYIPNSGEKGIEKIAYFDEFVAVNKAGKQTPAGIPAEYRLDKVKSSEAAPAIELTLNSEKPAGWAVAMGETNPGEVAANMNNTLAEIHVMSGMNNTPSGQKIFVNMANNGVHMDTGQIPGKAGVEIRTAVKNITKNTELTEVQKADEIVKVYTNPDIKPVYGSTSPHGMIAIATNLKRGFGVFSFDLQETLDFINKYGALFEAPDEIDLAKAGELVDIINPDIRISSEVHEALPVIDFEWKEYNVNQSISAEGRIYGPDLPEGFDIPTPPPEGGVPFGVKPGGDRFEQHGLPIHTRIATTIQRYTLDRYAYANRVAGIAARIYEEIHGEAMSAFESAETMLAFARGTGSAISYRVRKVQEGFLELSQHLTPSPEGYIFGDLSKAANFEITVDNYLILRQNIAILERRRIRGDKADRKIAWLDHNGNKQVLSFEQMQTRMKLIEAHPDSDKIIKAADLVSDEYRVQLENMVKHNLVDTDFADMLRKAYPHYIPMNHVEDVIADLTDTASSVPMAAAGSFGDDPIKFLDDKALLAGDNVIIRPIKNLAPALLHLETAGRVNQAALNLINHKLLIGGDVGASPNIDMPVGRGGIGNVKRWEEKWQESKLAQKHGGVKRRDMPINVSWELRRGTDKIINKERINTYLNNNGLSKTHTVVKVRSANGFPQTQFWALPKREAQAVIEAGQRLPANALERIFRNWVNAPFKGLYVYYNPSFAAYQLTMDTLTTFMRHGPMGLAYEVDELLGIVHLRNQEKWSKLHEEVQKRVGEIGFHDRRSRRGLGKGQTSSGDMAVNVNIRASGDRGVDFNQVFADVFSEEMPLGISIDKTKVTKLSDGSFTRGGGIKWDEINSKSGIASLLMSPLDSYQRFASKLEMAPRWAAARRTYKKTGDYDAAALAFRRATVDFQRGGVWTQAIDSFYAFANVAAQGAVQPIRIAKENPIMFASMAGLLGSANAGLFLYNSSNETYWDIPLRDRLGPILVLDNSHMPINPSTGRRNPYYVKLMPGSMREWSFIWAPQVMLQEQMHLIAQEKYGNTDMVTEGLFQMLSDMNPAAPIDIDADVYSWKENPLGAMARTAASAGTVGLGVQAAVENATNFNSFTGREIMPKWMEDIPIEQRYDRNTSEVAKKVGPLIGSGISPIKLQNLLKLDWINDAVAVVDLVMSAKEVGASSPHVVIWAEEMYSEIQDMGTKGRKPHEIQAFVNDFLNLIPVGYHKEVMTISHKFADGRTVLGSTEHNTKAKHWPILNDFARRTTRASHGGSLRATLRDRARSKAGVHITQQRKATSVMSNQFRLRDEISWAREDQAVETGNYAKWRTDTQKDDALFFGGLQSILVEAGITDKDLLIDGIMPGDDLDSLLSNWRRSIEAFTTGDTEEYLLDDVTWFALKQLRPKAKLRPDGKESADMDMATYFEEKKSFWNEVALDRGPETVERLKLREFANRTPVDKKYSKDMESYIVPTWEEARVLAYADITPAEVEAHKKFKALPADTRATAGLDPENEDYVMYQAVEELVSSYTKVLRSKNPIIDSKFVKWGYATTAVTSTRDVGMYEQEDGTWQYFPERNRFRSIRDKKNTPSGENSLIQRQTAGDPTTPDSIRDQIRGIQDEKSRRERNRNSRNDIYGRTPVEVDNRMSVP